MAQNLESDLTKALDHLRVAIEAANEELRQTPGADAASVPVEDLHTDMLQAYLELVEVDGQRQICLTMDSQGLRSKVMYTPLAALSVDERVKAAVQIPALIDLAKSKCGQLASDVDEIARDIEQTISQYKLNAGKAKGNRPRRSK